MTKFLMCQHILYINNNINYVLNQYYLYVTITAKMTVDLAAIMVVILNQHYLHTIRRLYFLLSLKNLYVEVCLIN